MTQPASLTGFFAGGGKAAKFPTIGTTVSGTIKAIHPPEVQRDYESGNELPGKYQVRIELATDLRDPEIEFDDGSRTLYVKGWMQGAIGNALRKAGVKEPQAGATLSVTYVRDGQPNRPGMRGPKQYEATYTPSSGTGDFFGGQPAQAPVAAPDGNAPIPDTPPAGIDPKAWAAMPTDAKQAIANTMALPPY